MRATFAYFEYRQFRLAAACAECMNRKYKLPSLSLLNMSCRICLNGSFYIIVLLFLIINFVQKECKDFMHLKQESLSSLFNIFTCKVLLKLK